MKYTNQNNSIIRNSDGANIPPDEGNRDYQDYLAWVAAGSPEEYDPIIPVPETQNDEQDEQATE